MIRLELFASKGEGVIDGVEASVSCQRGVSLAPTHMRRETQDVSLPLTSNCVTPVDGRRRPGRDDWAPALRI